MIRLLLVDDHAVVRYGLSMLLSNTADLQVVGEAADGNEAIQKTLDLKPDVIIMDISMPHGKDGMSATAEIKKMFPEISIIILTMHDEEEYLFRMIQNGASGYVLKNAPHDELLTAIRTVHKGDAYLHPGATRRLMQDYIDKMKNGELLDSFESLSAREKEVLQYIARGYANKEIADLMMISVKTVETHRVHVMEKLQLKTRPELVRYAMRKGMLNY